MMNTYCSGDGIAVALLPAQAHTDTQLPPRLHALACMCRQACSVSLAHPGSLTVFHTLAASLICTHGCTFAPPSTLPPSHPPTLPPSHPPTLPPSHLPHPRPPTQPPPGRRIRAGFYTERDAARLVREIVRTVAQCHSQGVMMRDIKPENVGGLCAWEGGRARA
jgi:hypothetical protein